MIVCNRSFLTSKRGKSPPPPPPPPKKKKQKNAGGGPNLACDPNWGRNDLFHSNVVERPLKLVCFIKLF